MPSNTRRDDVSLSCKPDSSASTTPTAFYVMMALLVVGFLYLVGMLFVL